MFEQWNFSPTRHPTEYNSSRNSSAQAEIDTAAWKGVAFSIRRLSRSLGLQLPSGKQKANIVGRHKYVQRSIFIEYFRASSSHSASGWRCHMKSNSTTSLTVVIFLYQRNHLLSGTFQDYPPVLHSAHDQHNAQGTQQSTKHQAHRQVNIRALKGK